ncbi:MAG: hypothetical protein ABIO37_07530, partial [Caulobacteraceae bacterium]
MRKKGIAVDGASGGLGGVGLQLPPSPSLEPLKNEAKQRLRAMRQGGAPGAKLTDAQLAVARDYGFASWRALKARVEGPTVAGPLDAYVGSYRHDPDLLTNSVQTVTSEGGRLYMRQTGGAKLALVRDDDGGFGLPGLPTRYTFEWTGKGPATALIAHHPAGDVRIRRIDAATAERSEAAYLRTTEEQARPRTEVPIPLELLRRYVGWYASPFGYVIEVKRDGKRLMVQASGQSSTEFYPESERKFFSRLVAAQISFEVRGDIALGAALHQNGREHRLARVLPEEARRK